MTKGTTDRKARREGSEILVGRAFRRMGRHAFRTTSTLTRLYIARYRDTTKTTAKRSKHPRCPCPVLFRVCAVLPRCLATEFLFHVQGLQACRNRCTQLFYSDRRHEKFSMARFLALASIFLQHLRHEPRYHHLLHRNLHLHPQLQLHHHHHHRHRQTYHHPQCCYQHLRHHQNTQHHDSHHHHHHQHHHHHRHYHHNRHHPYHHHHYHQQHHGQNHPIIINSSSSIRVTIIQPFVLCLHHRHRHQRVGAPQPSPVSTWSQDQRGHLYHR